MKKILTITTVLLLLFCGSTKAQNAKTILDKTAATINAPGGAQAKFTMTGKLGSATGNIYIKGNRFYAQTAQGSTWYDGKTQWTYLKSTDEVNISTPTEAQQQSLNPYKFITVYKTGFNMTAKKKGTGYEVHLTAQNMKRTIKEMYIAVSATYLPQEIKMRTDKGWTTIRVSGFARKQLADTTFRFDAKKYPSAEIIDLR